MTVSIDNITSIESSPSTMGGDASGRTRVSQKTTLFDGRILNADDTLKWDLKGTGTATYTQNAQELAVTAGQYLVKQSRVWAQYFSGKPQDIEVTSINFKNQTGVIKRFGYFSSSAVAPYDTQLDGCWVESDGSTYRLICSRSGTETHNIPWTSWDSYGKIRDYDWSKFAVAEIDFLWLGGAVLRLFLCVDGKFILVHTIRDHAGIQSNIIFQSPNQPLRYEIRSSTGVGSLTAVCSAITTEGAGIAESAQGLATNSISISTNTVGVVYPLCAVRKQTNNRNYYIVTSEFGVTQTNGVNDSGILYLLHNPTYSAPLTWVANSKVEFGTVTTQTITNVGRILKAIPISGNAVGVQAPNAALRVLDCGIDNRMSELVVAYTPLTANQSVAGTLQVLEY